MTLANLPPLVTVFGGSGFIGRHVVRTLAKRGYRIRVAVRRPDLAGFLQPLGNVGQISFAQANLRYRQSIDKAVEDADYVVNCVGLLLESGRNTFDAVQEFGARAIAEASRAAGAKLTHLSAIGATPTLHRPMPAPRVVRKLPYRAFCQTRLSCVLPSYSAMKTNSSTNLLAWRRPCRSCR